MDSLLHFLHLLPRQLIGFYYLFFGLWNIYHWTPILQTMIGRHIPLPWLVLQVGIAFQTIAGGLIMAGIFPGIAALTLIPFTMVAVFIFHPFWLHRGELFRLHFSMFIANMTVSVSALLLLGLMNI